MSFFTTAVATYSTGFPQGKKTHKHKQICGIVPGLGGCQKFVYVFFCSGHFLWGEKKTHKQNSPKNPGTIPWKFSLRVFSLCVFLLPISIEHLNSENLEKVVTVYFQKTPPTGVDKVQASVDTRFAAGLPFPVPVS